MTKVVGYTDLKEKQILLANEIKQKVNDLGSLLEALKEDDNIDKRALSIAITELQTSSMWAVRSVFKPDSFA